MKNKITQKIILICINSVLIALTSTIFAEPITATPTIEIQVNSDSIDERKQAFIKTLEELLVKESNNLNITALPTIKTALSNPSVYIERYTYVAPNITSSNSNTPQTLFLQIQFNQAAITQLLQQNKVDRSQVLAWLVKVTLPGNKTMEGTNSNDNIVHVFKKTAQDFGISIMLPTYDLQDINYIKPDDVCNLNAAIIKNASERYKTSTIMAGCIKEPVKNNLWTSRWLFLRDNKIEAFNISGATIESIMIQTINTFASKKFVLRIANINGLEQYTELMKYLITFNKIARINLTKIGPSTAELSVNIIAGDKQTLLSAINTQNKLACTSSSIDLDCKWVTTNNEQYQTIGAKPLP